MSKTVCNAISHGLCVTAWGGLTPCCATNEDFSHLTVDNNIVNYWHNNERLNQARKTEEKIWQPECTGCARKENQGIIHRKQKLNTWYPDVDSEFTKNNPNDIIHLDISFGNTCSQQCIMCNSNYSSKWLSDDVQLKQTFPGNTSLRPWNEIRLKNWSISYENLKEIAELISEKTRTVEIKGGEPLYDKRFEYFIDLVLDKNPNVKFNTNTNGMHFTDKNIEMLNRIKKINVDVSVDGTGIFYEWIRSSKWEDFLSNWHNAMQKINHNLNINFTSSVYNIDKIQSMYEFVEETYNTYGYFGTLNFTQIATSPKYQEPKYANKNRIEEGIRQIEIIEKDPANIFVGKSRFYFDKLTALKKYLINCLDFEVSDSEYEKFLKDHTAMVQVRGWDIRDYTNL